MVVARFHVIAVIVDAVNVVESGTTGRAVATRPTFDRVIACPTVDAVITLVTEQIVVAAAAEDAILATTAVDFVRSIGSADQVISATGKHSAGTRQHDHVPVRRSTDDASRANDGRPLALAAQGLSHLWSIGRRKGRRGASEANPDQRNRRNSQDAELLTRIPDPAPPTVPTTFPTHILATRALPGN